MNPVVIVISSVPDRDLDAAAELARATLWPVLIAHAEKGYGKALAKAFAQASEFGYSHAIVMDIGRSHSPAYLSRFLDEMTHHPEAIVVGYRQYAADRPTRIQRLGRWNCNLWTWIETNHWIHDSVYGYKAYPLAPVAELTVRAKEDDYEIELLAKASWIGVPIRQIALPTDARDERLAPLSIADAIRFGITTMALSLQRLALPEPLRAMIHRREFSELPLLERIRVVSREAIAHNCQKPGRFAACVGLGVFFGIVPIWGFQMLAAAMTAHLLRLSKPLVLTASHVSSPLTLPLILYGSLVFGHLLLHGSLGALPRLNQLGPAVLLHSLGEYLLGATVLAVTAGLAALVISFIAAATVKRIRRIA